jgi:hypothetical protein
VEEYLTEEDRKNLAAMRFWVEHLVVAVLVIALKLLDDLLRWLLARLF